jgi:hypothetical protein
MEDLNERAPRPLLMGVVLYGLAGVLGYLAARGRAPQRVG